MPHLFDWFNSLLLRALFPLVCSQFVHQIAQPEALRVNDAFVVKYNADEGQNWLPVHTDSSELSFTIALNSISDYEGGGTWIEALGDAIRVDSGQVLMFPGKLRHAGSRISSGLRYIIVAFLGYNEELCSEKMRLEAEYFDTMILP